jgi:1,4-alpha-glucan branching enzyme
LSAAAPPTDPALQALCAGRHDDPFAVLGPHDMSGLRYVTAFDPGAAALSARAGGDTFGLAAVPGHPGLFRGPVPGDGPYRLTGETPDGIPFDHDDPYRFGPVLGEIDEYLIGEGTHRRLWTALGAHVMRHEGVDGTHFAVWAPNAQRVSVVGDFNGWDGRRHAMRRRGSTGVWEIFLPGIGDGAAYKYELLGPDGLPRPLKADPVGFGAEHPPRTASVVRDIAGYGWHDAAWMAGRGAKNARNAPIAIYEVHLGSWKRRKDDDGPHASPTRKRPKELVDYVHDMGFTHIEFLPLSEHPFDGSWGYQPVGIYAPTIRHGPPHEFRDLVEAAHREGHRHDARLGAGPFPRPMRTGSVRSTARRSTSMPIRARAITTDWNTLIFNFGRTRSFQLSDRLKCALLAGGISSSTDCGWMPSPRCSTATIRARGRVGAECSWRPREPRSHRDVADDEHAPSMARSPGIMTAAEESTSFPGVSRPVDDRRPGFRLQVEHGLDERHAGLHRARTDPPASIIITR